MKAVRFRFVSIKNFRWIGIYVFRTFTIPPIYDFFPKTFYRRTLVKHMANSFTRSITLFAFWRRFNIHFPKALVGWKNIVDEFQLKTSWLIFNGDFEWKLIYGTRSECLFSLIGFSSWRAERFLSKH